MMEDIGLRLSDWQGTLKYSLIGVLGFLGIMKAVPGLSIGLPWFSVASGLRTLTVILLAPIVEESFFRLTLFKYMIEKIGMGRALAFVAQALTFALYHLAAYGVNLSEYSKLSQVLSGVSLSLGLFIGAFFFGLISQWLVEKTDNILPSIIAHFLINLYLAKFVIVGV